MLPEALKSHFRNMMAMDCDTGFLHQSEPKQHHDHKTTTTNNNVGEASVPLAVKRILKTESTSETTASSTERLAVSDGSTSTTSHKSDVEGGKPQLQIETTPATKKIIEKLLKDYEEMERRYHQERQQHATDVQTMQKQMQQMQAGTIEIALLQTENSSVTNIPNNHDNSTRQGENVDQQQGVCAININEEDQFDRNDSNDNHNDKDDDLSSKVIDILIDEDANSDCKAVADHLGDSRQYWRDIILGVNDGLVSTFLLVAGVAGGGLSTLDILLTAIAGAVAGAVSMCAGEYVATKSQNEVVQGEIKLEKNHISNHHRDELLEVTGLLELIGITRQDRDLQKRLLKHYASDSDALLKIMVALELGFLEDEVRSPAMAGFVSFFLFLIGAVPSVIPFTIPDIDPTTGLIASAVATSTSLLIVGAVKTWATKGNCLTAALENLFVAGFGGAIAYGTGLLTQKILHDN